MPIDAPVSGFLPFAETVTGLHFLVILSLSGAVAALTALFWTYRHHKILQQRLFQLQQERDYLQAIIESNRQGLFSLQNRLVMPPHLLPFWQRWGGWIRTRTFFFSGGNAVGWEKPNNDMAAGAAGHRGDHRDEADDYRDGADAETVMSQGMAYFQGAMTNGSFARMVGVAGTWSYSDTGIENGGHHLQGYERLRANLNLSDRQKLDLALSQLCGQTQNFDVQVTLETPPRLLHISGYHLLRTGDRATGTESDILGCVLWVQDQSAQANQDFVRLEMVQARQEAVQLRAMLDALPFPVWRRDMHLDVVDANLAYKQMLETDLPVRRGPLPELLRGPLDRVGIQIAEHALTPQNDGHANQVVEEHHLVIGGKRLLLSFSECAISPLLSLNRGSMPEETDMSFDMSQVTLAREGTIGWAQDLTDQETMQRDLQRHTRSHQQTLQNLTIPIEIYGPDQRLRFYNDAYAKLWDLDVMWLDTRPKMTEVLEQMRISRKLPEVANFPAFKEARQRLFTMLVDPQTDLNHLPDGTVLRMTVAPHPLGGLILTYEDVTDRLALQRSYNELIDVQRETLDQLYEGVAVYGSDGRVKLCNPSFLRLWQLPVDLLEEKPHISDIVSMTRAFFDPVGAWEDYHNWMIDLIADPKQENGRLERNDHSILEYSCVPLPDGGVLFTYLDITRSSRSERQLHQKMESLEISRQVRGAYLEAVLSNVMTPMSRISGFADILVNSYAGALNDQQIEFAHSIRQTAHFVTETLMDVMSQKDFLLDLDQSTNDEISAITTMQDILSQIDQLCREDLRRAEISLIQDIQPVAEHVQIAAPYLKQALFALIQEVTQAAIFRRLGGQDSQALHILVNKLSETGPESETESGYVTIDITCHLPLQTEDSLVAQEMLEANSGDTTDSPAYRLLAKVITYHHGQIKQTILENRQQQIHITLPIIGRDDRYMPLPGYELLPTKILQ